MSKFFKLIPGYEDYLVSENGEIFSIKRRKFLKPRKNKDGYLRFNLYNNKKCKDITLHRLVAMTYIPNPENLPQINHKNGIKTDNRVENLEWCTASQNNKHAFKLGLKEKTREAVRKNGKINCKYAHEACIKHLNPELKNLFDDIFINKLKNKDVAKKYNLKQGYVSKVKTGRQLKHALQEYFNFGG